MDGFGGSEDFRITPQTSHIGLWCRCLGEPVGCMAVALADACQEPEKFAEKSIYLSDAYRADVRLRSLCLKALNTQTPEALKQTSPVNHKPCNPNLLQAATTPEARSPVGDGQSALHQVEQLLGIVGRDRLVLGHLFPRFPF